MRGWFCGYCDVFMNTWHTECHQCGKTRTTEEIRPLAGSEPTLYKVMGLIDNALTYVQVGLTLEEVLEVSCPWYDLPEEDQKQADASYEAFRQQLTATGHAVMADRYKVFPTDDKETESVFVAFKI